MNLYSSISKYLLPYTIDSNHPLFTYFVPKYKISMDENNPFIKITLVTKVKEIEMMSYLQYYDSTPLYSSSICGSTDLDILKITITYLFNDENFVKELKELDEYFASHAKNKQQTYFDQIIQEQLKEMSEEDSLNKVHIEPYFYDARNAYAIEAKLGIGKYYKIANLSRFLSYFDNKEKCRYGKDLTIVHSLSNFDKPSQEFIKLLKSRINTYFVIKGYLVDEICEQYINQTIYIEDVPYLVSDKKYDYKIIIDNDFHLSIKKEGESLEPFGNRFYIDKINNIIVKYDYDEHIAKLIEVINDYPLADIRNSLMDFKYTYLSKYPDVFILEDEVQKELNNDLFKIKSYLDYEDGKIYLTYKLFYEDKPVDIADIYSLTAMKIYKTYLNILSRYGFNDKHIIEDPLFVFQFLNSSLQDLRNISELYISENLSNKKVSVFSSPNIAIKKEGNLLSILLEDSIYSEEELKEIFLAIKKKKKFILLKDNFIDLSNKDSDSFFQSVSSFDLFNGKKIATQKQLPLYFAFKKLGINSDKLEIDQYIDNAFNDVKSFSTSDISIPHINGKLRSYQKDGVKWLYSLYKNQLGGILADDMGLGKTIEAIAFMKLIDANAPHLIVCPKSLLFNWISEFKKFYPEMTTKAISGTINERKNIINSIKNNAKAVYFISYDSLRNEINNLKNIHFDLCILDEAQFIKNAFAKKTDAVKNINADHHYALTGTPIENNIYDMWSIFDFLMPHYLGDLKSFQDNYESDEKYKEQLKLLVAPFILRRKKEDVLKDLPEKYEILYTVEMTTQQRKIYESYIYNAKESMKDSSGKDMIKILSLLTRLRQLCIHPSLFVENYNGGSGKLDALKEIITDKINDGHRMLIFSQFVSALAILKEQLEEMKIRYEMITGDTEAKDRLDICNNFNNNEDIKIVLISLKAGGTGLNLIGADTVIHLDPWWNLAAQNQASDRAHRIGQTRAVEVIQLIAENSIEQRVIELQNEKKQLVEMMISDNEDSIKKLSIEDLKYLLSSRT